MAQVASSESSFGSFFSADWYSPMDLIRNIPGWGDQDPLAGEQTPQSFTGPSQVDSCCLEAPKLKTILLEKESPDGMQLAKEEPAVPEKDALRLKVKETLLDASLSGSLLATLAQLEQMRSEDALSDSASSGQSESSFGELVDVRNHVSTEAHSKAPWQHSEASESDASDEQAHHPFGIACEQIGTPMGYSASAMRDRQRPKDALTKSKRPEATDAEQLELQAKTALLDDVRTPKARLTSPRKGKRLGSPKKGGS